MSYILLLLSPFPISHQAFFNLCVSQVHANAHTHTNKHIHTLGIFNMHMTTKCQTFKEITLWHQNWLSQRQTLRLIRHQIILSLVENPYFRLKIRFPVVPRTLQMYFLGEFQQQTVLLASLLRKAKVTSEKLLLPLSSQEVGIYLPQI